MSSCAVAVFVKTPGHSPVKSRLAAITGASFAGELYRRCVLATGSVVEAAAADGTITPYWAVAEAEAVGEWAGFDNVAQGEGGLGERMGRVYAALLERHPAVVLIGADSPQLEAADLLAAASRLDRSPPLIVLGPALDGGFWLMGGNCPLPMTEWRAVPYRREDTRERFVDRVRGHASLINLRPLSDVDDVDDLAPLVAGLEDIERPTREQSALLLWVRKQMTTDGGRLRPWSGAGQPSDGSSDVS